MIHFRTTLLAVALAGAGASCHDSPASPSPLSSPTPSPSASAFQPTGPAGAWNLVFDDEFDGTSVDTAKWNPAWPWPTPLNSSLQNYAPSSATVSDGMLHLTATHVSSGGEQYTSGALTTYQTFSFTYGVVEARLQAPAGNGLWSGFWMIYPTGVWPPEIDVVEILGNEPSLGFLTYHYLDGSTQEASHIPAAQTADYSAGFHVFTVDWEPASVTWYVDGVNQGTFSSEIATQPMFILLDLDVGGSAGGFTPGPPDGTTPFPSELAVDYVRVWQKP